MKKESSGPLLILYIWILKLLLLLSEQELVVENKDNVNK